MPRGVNRCIPREEIATIGAPLHESHQVSQAKKRDVEPMRADLQRPGMIIIPFIDESVDSPNASHSPLKSLLQAWKHDQAFFIANACLRGSLTLPGLDHFAERKSVS